jgi:hypothetical protein
VAFEAAVLSVLIASPGDTSDARDVVETTIAGFNRDRARGAKIIL